MAFDNIAHLKSKSNKELENLLKTWQNALETMEKDGKNFPLATDQIAIIKMIYAERIGK